MVDFIKKRPMLLCALVSSVISVISFYSEAALFVLALGFVGLLFFLIYKRIKGTLVFACLFILAIAVSAFVTCTNAAKVSETDGSICKGKFIVTDNPENHGIYYTATLETVESNILSGGEKVLVYYYENKLEFSQIIEAEITLSAQDEIQYKRIDYSSGIFIRGYINDFSYTGKNDDALSAVDNVRQYIKTTVFDNYTPDTGATVMALVAGDKNYLSDGFYSNVKGAGVAHVMVVSGMHLSVIVSLFLYLCNRFVYNRFIKAITILFVTIVVAAVCGFTMSIIRAGITYVIMAVGLAFDRENTPENTLGFAVSIILLINPFAIFNVAFLLSVLSTFAILVVAVPITEFLSYRKIIKSKFLLAIASSVIISVSTLIFTAPVTIYVFGYMSTVSVLTNLLISTAASGSMIFCILGFIFPFLSAPLFGASEMITKYINSVINYFGSLKYSVVQMPKWTVFLFIALIIVILWVLVACKVRADMLKSKETDDLKLKERGRGINGSNFRASLKKRNKKCGS